MGQSKRRSVVTDRSSRNHGDQPLSPPETPCPPFSKKTDDNTQQLFREAKGGNHNFSPWEIAKLIAFNPEDSTGVTLTERVRLQPSTTEGTDRRNTTASQEAEGHRVVEKRNKWGDRKNYEPCTQNIPPPNEPKQAITLPLRDSSVGSSPSAFLHEALGIERQRVHCIVFALATTLGSLAVLSETFGLRQPHLVQKLGLVSVLLSALPGASLACICYMRMPRRHEIFHASSTTSNNSTLKEFSTRLTPKGVAALRLCRELHKDFSLNALKALSSFILWDMLRTYATFWPLVHTPVILLNESLNEPPLFGPAADGATIGVSGFPPRRAGQVPLPSLLPLLHGFLPLLAGGARLLGLWFSLKTFSPEQASNKTRFSTGWAYGGGQMLLFMLVAFPIASVVLQQAVSGCGCLQPFAGMVPLVEEQALGDLLLCCHTLLFAAAAALTGAVVAAAFKRLTAQHTRSASKILGLLAALAFFCCILFDVLAAAGPSASPSCVCSLHASELQNDSNATQSFATAASLSHSLALLFLSCCASLFGLKDAVGATFENHPVDEVSALAVSTLR